jgi:hypothetical protein
MIIIEGADHLGKTTLAKAVAEKLGWKYFHHTKPRPKFSYFSEYLEQARPESVWDRYHLGAMVYGEWLGCHRTSLTPTRMGRISRFLQWQGAMIVIVYTSDHQWYENFLATDKKKEMFDVDTIMDANRCFGYLTAFPVIGGIEVAHTAINIGNAQWPDPDVVIQMWEHFNAQR